MNEKAKTQLERAKEIALEVHEGQYRWDGVTPYFRHPERVAESVEGEVLKTVAWLHDVLEDSFLTEDDLREQGFSEEVVAAVKVLTRREGQTYADYILAVKGNTVALLVKVEDLTDNLKDTTDSLKVRYTKSLKVLKGEV